MAMSKVKMVAPIGELPKTDEDLKKRIERLGKNPSSKVFCETIETWEKEMVAKYRKAEQKAQSCVLDG